MRGTRTSGTDCIRTTSANGRITHDDVKSQSRRSRGAGVIVNAEVTVLNSKHAKTNEVFVTTKRCKSALFLRNLMNPMKPWKLVKSENMQVEKEIIERLKQLLSPW